MKCPHCGARVPPRATSCPGCGSDDQTGWADGETVDYEATDLPDAYDPERWEREISHDRMRRTRLIVIAAAVAFFLVCVAIGMGRGR